MLKLFGDITLGYEVDGFCLAVAARVDRMQRPAAGALRVLCARPAGQGLGLPRSVVVRIVHWLRMAHWRLARSRMFDTEAIRSACDCRSEGWYDREDLSEEDFDEDNLGKRLSNRCFGGNADGTLHRAPDPPRCTGSKLEVQTQLSVLALVRCLAHEYTDVAGGCRLRPPVRLRHGGTGVGGHPALRVGRRH